MPSNLVVFGDKTANEVLEAAILGYSHLFKNIEKVYFQEPDFSETYLPRLSQSNNEMFYITGVANVEVKRLITARCREIGWKPFTIVHPRAFVAESAQMGDGVFVAPMAVVSSNAIIGNHSIVHIHASIGHDAVVGEGSVILPGARVSGSVRIGDRSLVGSNAFLNAGIRIGHDCQVDALTYVSRDLADGHILSVRAKGPLKRVGF